MRLVCGLCEWGIDEGCVGMDAADTDVMMLVVGDWRRGDGRRLGWNEVAVVG